MSINNNNDIIIIIIILLCVLFCYLCCSGVSVHLYWLRCWYFCCGVKKLVNEYRIELNNNNNNYYYYYYLQPLWKVHAIMHLKQIMFLWYIMLELRALCGYKITIYGSACNAIYHDKNFVLLVYYYYY